MSVKMASAREGEREREYLLKNRQPEMQNQAETTENTLSEAEISYFLYVNVIY